MYSFALKESISSLCLLIFLPERGPGVKIFSGGVRPVVRASFLLVRRAFLIHLPQNTGAYYIWRMQYTYPLKSEHCIHLLRDVRYRLQSEFK